MPYISSERVAEIRKEIKSLFPAFKFSITKEHHSSVNVAILSGPVELIVKRYRYEDEHEARQMEKRYQQVNKHTIEECYKDYPEIEKMISKIYEVMNVGNGVEVEDGDYGTVPNFYVNVRIGEWDRPYLVVESKKKVGLKEEIQKTVEFLAQVDMELDGEVSEGTKEAAQVQKVEIPVVAGEVNIIDYSTKAIAVIGDTKPIKDKLKELGGRFNFRLSCGPGWIFPKTALDRIQVALTS